MSPARLARRVGRRGAALACLAVLDLVWAWSLLDPTASRQLRAAPSYQAILHVAPLHAWAAVWALVGLVCAAHALRRRDRAAWAAAIAVKLAWAALTGWAWLTVPGASRAWAAMVIWAAFAGLIGVVAGWAEPPSGVR